MKSMPIGTRRGACRWLLFLLTLMTLPSAAPPPGKDEAAEQLGRALEYFQGGKYHEALILFKGLEKEYRLNPRFLAYTGICYYYEWDYAQAAKLLGKAIPKLDAFSPDERSFYCFACAESLFNLGEYSKALPYYDKMLTLCQDNEKADAYYRIGFIHIDKEEWRAALDNLQNALVFYQQFKPDEKQRIAQIKNMITGCCEKIDSQAMNENNQKE